MGDSYHRISDLLKGDLPGCEEGIDTVAFNNIIHSMQLLLRLLTSDGFSTAIINAIKEESKLIDQVDLIEYTLNETQFEIRRFKTHPDRERQILDRWCRIIMERYGADEALDFHSAVTYFRQYRTLDL